MHSHVHTASTHRVVTEGKKQRVHAAQFIQLELENVNAFNNSQINNPEYIAFKCFIYFNEILLKEVLQCQAMESTL